MADDLTGKKIGPFEFHDAIGQSAVATVYRALHTEASRMMALKVFLPSLGHDRAFVDRFEREMRLVANMDHFHIVPVYHVGLLDNRPYVAMRLMQGGRLADWIERMGMVPPVTGLAVIRQVASALDYAHKQGHIHRDLNPHNILFDENGDTYVSDFSLDSLREAKIAHGRVYGVKPAYMAPEMVDPRTILTPTVDIYALGVILFQMLTGQLPFSGATPEAMAEAHVKLDVPSIRALNPDISEEIEGIVLKALSKKPQDRFSTAGEVAVLIGQALEMTDTPRYGMPDSRSADGAADAVTGGDDDEHSTAELTPPYPINLGQGPDPRDMTPTVPPPVFAELEEREHPTPLFGPSPDDVRQASERIMAGLKSPSDKLATRDLPSDEGAVEEGPPTKPTGTIDTKDERKLRRQRMRQIRRATRRRLPWYTVVLTVLVLMIVWFLLGVVGGVEVRRQVNVVTLVAIHAEQTAFNETATAEFEETLAAEAGATATQDALLIAETASVTTDEATEPPIPEETPTPTIMPTPLGGSLGRVAFVSNRDGDDEVFILDLATGERIQATTNDVEDGAPNWSPDGTLLAFDSVETSTGGRHIFVVDENGEKRQEVTGGVKVDRFPQWSPDGDRLLYYSLDGTRNYVRSVVLDTGLESDIVQLPVPVTPLAWSDDGVSLLAFGRTVDNQLDILDIDLRTGERARVTNQVGLISHMDISADGSMAVFTWQLNGRRQLFTVGLNECEGFINQCEWTRLTDDTFNYRTPRFSPDGSLLLVTADRFGSLDLFIMDLTGEVVQRVTDSDFDEFDGVWQPVTTP